MLPPAHPLHLPMGLIIWSLWFVTVYGGLSVACDIAAPSPMLGPWTWINGLLLVLTLVVTLLLLLLAVRSWQAPAQAHNRFITRVAAGVYLAAAIATAGVGVPVIVLPPCI